MAIFIKIAFFACQNMKRIEKLARERLLGRLGSPLGSPGLVGPPWATDCFFQFLGSPLVRPKWPCRFCSNIQKQAIFCMFCGNLAQKSLRIEGRQLQKLGFYCCFFTNFIWSPGALWCHVGVDKNLLLVSWELKKRLPDGAPTHIFATFLFFFVSVF